MSLIHEALEKLEQEKAPVEGIKKPALLPQEKPLHGEERSRPDHRMIFAMGGALLVFFIAGIVYLMGRSFSTAASSGVNVSSSKSSADLFSGPAASRRFSLTGITETDGDLIAVINNELVRTGDRIGGGLIEEIHKDKVILDLNGRQITLDL